MFNIIHNRWCISLKAECIIIIIARFVLQRRHRFVAEFVSDSALPESTPSSFGLANSMRFPSFVPVSYSGRSARPAVESHRTRQRSTCAINEMAAPSDMCSCGIRSLYAPGYLICTAHSARYDKFILEYNLPVLFRIPCRFVSPIISFIRGNNRLYSYFTRILLKLRRRLGN